VAHLTADVVVATANKVARTVTVKISEDIKLLILLVAVIASMALMFLQPTTLPERTRVFYDCRIAEISPDVPPLVKQECRKLQERKMK
jgi:hypothetical protein